MPDVASQMTLPGRWQQRSGGVPLAPREQAWAPQPHSRSAHCPGRATLTVPAIPRTHDIGVDVLHVSLTPAPGLALESEVGWDIQYLAVCP
jgi:hypothetical protein